jgi:DNA polymerase I-like protein with 3'-5' exonuclease and polymerase domains
MKIPKPITIDFETFGITGRPDYPPVPVGVSIKYPGKKAHYYAWGHPSENNCTYPEAVVALSAAWKLGESAGLLFQNGKFDVDVAETHMGMPRLHPLCYHDMLFLLFLDDPHQRELGLKPSANRLLQMPPEERDAVGDWLVEHQPVPGVKISMSTKSEHYYGRYIALAPGGLVGRYADGDVVRTEKLFQLLYKKTVERGMLAAYDRERQLMPILMEMERQGVPIDLKRLSDDVRRYFVIHQQLTEWVQKKLKTPDMNVDSGDQLIEALIKCKLVDEDSLPRTDKGTYKTDKETLAEIISDAQLKGVLKYRTQLGTCLRTFMAPWLATAERSGGLIFTSWNQVKGDAGTRTGRLSSTPNFQNIPKEFKPIFRHEESDAKKAKKLPVSPMKDLPPLPKVRSYVVPWSKEHVLLDRDYSQQELRILAHFEAGALLEAYQENNWLDVHDHATNILQNDHGIFPDLSHDDARKPVKNTVFGLIYGMGVGKLALKSDITVDYAKKVKDAVLTAFPGLKQMYRDMKTISQANEPIHTWGGREYFCEPPQIINGKMQTYDYKMLNVLVQGSAADCTKEALIRYWPVKHPEARVLLTVHDEFLVSCPKGIMAMEMQKLRECMNSIEFDVPMLSEGKTSETNWSELKDYDKKGKVLK